MTRREMKQLLRKGEEALAERFPEAQQAFTELLDSFKAYTPSLLDHAAGIYGLVRALYGLNRDEEAAEFAQSAVDLLSVHQELEIAA